MPITPLAHSSRAMPGLVVEVSSEGATTVLTLRGEADLFTLPLLVEELRGVITDRTGPVVVDLAPTLFIDTATARGLRRAAQTLGDGGRLMTVRSPSRLAERVLTVAGLSTLIEPRAAAAS